MKLTEENSEDIRWGILCKKITLCETCDTVFKYSPNRKFCDVCVRKRRRAYERRPEQKETRKEYDRLRYLRKKEERGNVTG